MNTVFQTGPGFYAASTCKVDKTIAPDIIRCYCARIEAYDLEVTAGESMDMDQTRFELLVAKAEKQPGLATALLQLAASIRSNEQLLKGIELKDRR